MKSFIDSAKKYQKKWEEQTQKKLTIKNSYHLNSFIRVKGSNTIYYITSEGFYRKVIGDKPDAIITVITPEDFNIYMRGEDLHSNSPAGLEANFVKVISADISTTDVGKRQLDWSDRVKLRGMVKGKGYKGFVKFGNPKYSWAYKQFDDQDVLCTPSSFPDSKLKKNSRIASVNIGPSRTNSVTIDISRYCDLGLPKDFLLTNRPTNPQNPAWDDTFEVKRVSDTEFSVRRSDSQSGWGQHLSLLGFDSIDVYCESTKFPDNETIMQNVTLEGDAHEKCKNLASGFGENTSFAVYKSGVQKTCIIDKSGKNFFNKPLVGSAPKNYYPFAPKTNKDCQGKNQPKNDGGCNDQCTKYGFKFYDKDIGCFNDEQAALDEINDSSSGKNIYKRAPGAGGWGGVYTCPDGNKYVVGDNNNYCGSLAGTGGTEGPCIRDYANKMGKTGWRVDCAKPSNNTVNVYSLHKDSSNVGKAGYVDDSGKLYHQLRYPCPNNKYEPISNSDWSNMYDEKSTLNSCKAPKLEGDYLDKILPEMNKAAKVVEGFDDCDETLSGNNEDGYRGCQNKTVSGKTCQKWTSQYPNKHTRTPERYPNRGLGDHNYCRNPDDVSSGIWCYTTDPSKRWEHCEPKKPIKIDRKKSIKIDRKISKSLEDSNKYKPTNFKEQVGNLFNMFVKVEDNNKMLNNEIYTETTTQEGFNDYMEKDLQLKADAELSYMYLWFTLSLILLIIIVIKK